VLLGVVVPPEKLSTYGPRSFAVAGPTIWNKIPEYLRDPGLSIDNVSVENISVCTQY